MTWYQKLISCVEVAAFGAVARLLKSTVETGLFSKKPEINGLDSQVTTDVEKWFLENFRPWFAELSKKLGSATDKTVLLSPAYIIQVNQVITALHVARAYYAKLASEAYVSSIEEVNVLQAAFCEEMAKAVSYSNTRVLAQYGIEPKQGIAMTEASSYTGTTPEGFKWPGTVVANHKIFSHEETHINQPQPTAGQPLKAGKIFKDHLPWVFTAAFGLIAWSAAAKK